MARRFPALRSRRDLAGEADWAAEQVRVAHPDLNDEAVAALAWTYSHWRR